MAKITHKQPVLWKKRILIPFWVIRICLMLFVMVAYGWAINHLHDDPGVSTREKASIAVFMLFIVAVILIDFLAILLFARDALHPGTFLSMNCFQTGFWIGVLIMDIVGVVRGQSKVGLVFTIIVLLTFLTLLIYSIVGYNRMKREAARGNYAPAHNPVAPAPDAYNPGYNPPAFMQAAPYQQQVTYPYAHQTQPATELQGYPPQYQQGQSADYYNQQPVKAAAMV